MQCGAITLTAGDLQALIHPIDHLDPTSRVEIKRADNLILVTWYYTEGGSDSAVVYQGKVVERAE